MSDFESLIEYATTGNPTSKELIIIDEVKRAFNENSELKYLYLSFGPTARHRVMNLNHYSHNLEFGFTHKDLDEYNWLKSGDFEVERIEFETSHANHNPYVEIGKGPNGKWSYGYSFTMGAAGGGCKIHVFRDPINTRNECFDKALAYAKAEYEKCLNKNDTTNFNEALINQVLKSIDKIKCDSNQLALF